MFIQQQKDLVDKLQDQWDKVLTDPSLKEALELKGEEWRAVTERERELRDLHGKWTKYTVRVESGVAFYRQLLSYAQGIQVTPQTTLSYSLSNLNIGSAPYKSEHQNGQNQNQNQNFTGQSYLQQFQPASNQFNQYIPPQDLHQFQHQLQQFVQPHFTSNSQEYSQNPQGYSQNTHSSQNFHQPSREPSYSSNFQLSQIGYLGPAQNQAPPSLPPKTPSISSGQYHSNGEPLAPAHPQQQQQRSGGQTQDGLIYDQPSTYQPNMYNFFSSSN